jgi:hypothetical protein
MLRSEELPYVAVAEIGFNEKSHQEERVKPSKTSGEKATEAAAPGT